MKNDRVPPCQLRRALLGAAAAALALSPALALADCGLEAKIDFSYPSAGTREVPLNAVFWAVQGAGVVSFRLDGVELQRLDDSDAGRFQFVPPEALSPGVHDIEISVSQAQEGRAPEGETLQLQVEAVEQAPVEADATIEAVTYSPVWDGNGNIIREPPLEGTGEGCAELATLYFGCQDVLPMSLTRVDFSTRGDAVGYLLGRSILPPSCVTYFPYEYRAGETAPYTIQAILPTGLSAARTFEGEAQGLEAVTAAYDAELRRGAQGATPAGAPREPERIESCAIHFSTKSATFPSLLGLAAAGAIAASRRRLKVTRPPVRH